MNIFELTDSEKLDTFVDGRQLIIGEHNLDKYTKVIIKNISSSDWLFIAWSYFWRGLIVTFVATLIAALLGGIIGLIIGIVAAASQFDLNQNQIYLQITGFIVGGFVGFLSIIPFIRWILSSRIGKYKFLLVESYHTESN